MEADKTRSEVYSWLAKEQSHQHTQVELRQTASVNPVTGHGHDCECSKCPGWYDRRADLATRAVALGTPAPARRGSVLTEQVVPVCCLLATVTVCGLVLLPVVVPLMAISAVMIVAVSVVVVTGAVVVTRILGALNRVPADNGRVVLGRVKRRDR